MLNSLVMNGTELHESLITTESPKDKLERILETEGWAIYPPLPPEERNQLSVDVASIELRHPSHLITDDETIPMAYRYERIYYDPSRFAVTADVKNPKRDPTVIKTFKFAYDLEEPIFRNTLSIRRKQDP